MVKNSFGLFLATNGAFLYNHCVFAFLGDQRFLCNQWVFAFLGDQPLCLQSMGVCFFGRPTALFTITGCLLFGRPTALFTITRCLLFGRPQGSPLPVHRYQKFVVTTCTFHLVLQKLHCFLWVHIGQVVT